MIVIETGRLLLAEANITDSNFFLTLLNSPNWIKYIGDRKIKTIENAEKYILESLIKSYDKNGFGLYKMLLKSENRAIGICGLLQRSGLDYPDIGFAILPEYENKGYTYEAAKATLEYAVKVLKLEKVLAITSEENKGSRRILEKIKLEFIQKIKLGEETKEVLLYSN